MTVSQPLLPQATAGRPADTTNEQPKQKRIGHKPARRRSTYALPRHDGEGRGDDGTGVG